MSENHERIEALLKGAVPPEYQSEEHRQQLRNQILSRIETGRAGNRIGDAVEDGRAFAGPALRGSRSHGAGYAGAPLLFSGQGQGRRLHLHHHRAGDDLRGTNHPANGTPLRISNMRMTGIRTDSSKELNAAGIEQQRKDLEEIDALRQRNARELLSVTDTAVNGKVQPRAYTFQYVRTDGRKEVTCEPVPGPLQDPSPAQRERAGEEIAELRQRGEREVSHVWATEFEGHVVQRTLACRYTLSDGREETIGEDDPELPAAAKVLTPKQLLEVSKLGAVLKQRELLGSEQVQMYGKTFNFTKYSVTLSDGTRVVWSEGEPQGPKTSLTEADWKELHKLMAAHQGQTLSTLRGRGVGQGVAVYHGKGRLERRHGGHTVERKAWRRAVVRNLISERQRLTGDGGARCFPVRVHRCQSRWDCVIEPRAGPSWGSGTAGLPWGASPENIRNPEGGCITPTHAIAGREDATLAG